MGLDRRPDLIAHLLRLEGRSDQDEALERVTLVERSANVVREAFIKCLTDRSGTPGTQGKPEGKRVGIYLMANLCLKLLFQVRRRSTPRNSSRCLPAILVRKAAECGADVRQYQCPISSLGVLPCLPESHLPILPWTVSVLQQPLLSRANSPTVILRPMPSTSTKTTQPHPHLPDPLQHDDGPLPIPATPTTPRIARPSGTLHTDMQPDRPRRLHRLSLVPRRGLPANRVVRAQRHSAPPAQPVRGSGVAIAEPEGVRPRRVHGRCTRAGAAWSAAVSISK